VTGPAVSPATGRGEARFPVWGTTAHVVVTEARLAGPAAASLRARLAEIDRVGSRFRADSEIRRLPRGTWATVSPLLAELLEAALWSAAVTDGLEDLTVGTTLAALGYDRDLAELPPDGPAVHPTPAPGWWRVGWRPDTRAVRLPRGVEVDLGATAKAWAADRAAARLAAELGCGVLVGLGGDIAVAGPAPAGGWRIAVGDAHHSDRPHSDRHHPDRHHPDPPAETVAIVSGGLATSGVVRRRWRRGGRWWHHLVDPRSGRPASGTWRTVSVAAAGCLDANTASTAAMVLGTIRAANEHAYQRLDPQIAQLQAAIAQGREQAVRILGSDSGKAPQSP
jgi:thiamine biosynthesis lipoprotein